jgi:hypothetical protein
MRALFSVSLLLAGCYPPPDCAQGYARNDAGHCKGAALASETGSVDSGEPTGRDYSGPIEIDILAETESLVIEDVCVGTVQIAIDAGAIDGTLRCVFGGTVGGIIGSDPFSGTLSGAVAEHGTAAGPLDMDLAAFGALAASWTGNTTSEGLDGSFGEETIFVIGALEIPVIYTGTFSAR